jgi:type I restriction enzyme, S subunit
MTWPVVPLAEVAEVQGGIQKQPKRAPRDNAFPFLRVANVTASGLALDDIHEVELFNGELDRFRLQRGDLLVVEGNGSASQVGRAAVWDGSIKDAVHQNHLIRVRPAPELDERYLGLLWNSPTIRDELTRVASSTSGLHTLSVTKLKRITLPLPPLAEQHRIVDFLEDHLSRLDAAESYLSAARRRQDALERSALDAHFGGPDVPLSHLIEDISAGKSFGAANAPARDGEWGIIKVSAMTWGQFDPTQNKAVTSTDRVDPRFEIREGDLLVSRANTSGYVGASVVVRNVRPKLLLSDKSLRVTPRAGVESEWLWRSLQAPSARHQISALATGTKDSMRNISQAALKRVLLPNVSSGEQAAALRSFNGVADAIARLRHETATGAQRLEALRRALLAAAFDGRLTNSKRPDERLESVLGV